MSDEETAAQPPESPSGSAGLGAGMASEVSRRVGSILDAVEREAARLRDDARADAARYSENARRRADYLVEERRRRISELSDELVAKSEAVVARLDDAAPVREGFENLVRALGDAAERLSRESEETADAFEPPRFHDSSRSPAPAPTASYEPPAPPPAYEPSPQPAPAIPARQPPHPRMGQPETPGYGEAARSATWRRPDVARMVAIQMAGAGSSRGDVRRHLNDVLGIFDAEPVLDEIFGAGAGDDAQVPWMTGRR
jgi:hypothetical protein